MSTVSIRDSALRAVGRNVVNFQKLEQCLKALVRTSDVSGPTSTVRDKIEKRTSKVSVYTLGKAVQEWLHMSASEGASRPTTQDLFEPWISMSLGLSIDPEKLAKHNEVLNALASERNNLIHQDLANFDFNSDANCQDLIVNLDRQNERILEQLALLAPAIKGLIEMNKWAARPESQEELFNTFMIQGSTDET